MSERSGHAPGTITYADLPAGMPGTTPFAVVGDPQDTLWLERMIMRRESNRAERDRLFAHLAGRQPAFLAIAGDLTSSGWSSRAWRTFDRLMAPMRREGVPVLPIMGNHDYGILRANAARRFGDHGFVRALAARRFAARFPQFARARWYARTYGRLAMLFLDSNAAALTGEEWQRQKEWFAAALDACDGDPAVGGVLVFAHHPPFTNSTIFRDDAAVQEAFVERFVRSPKTVAMISGHAHAYEHFIERDRHFIVTGGGGGPRVRLLEGAARRHADLFVGASPRPFNYLWITPRPQGLSIVVEGLDKGATTLATIDRFELPFRAGGASAATSR
ncbi:MAG TPA: metallophosphoesterase [Gemmatimonadaceae bacterium]|nr:metallophosphoesterase [Gemmatimonadaceae bacterium]